jgi:hypothetical protein
VNLDASAPFADDLNTVEVDATAVTGEDRELQRRAIAGFPQQPLGPLDLRGAAGRDHREEQQRTEPTSTSFLAGSGGDFDGVNVSAGQEALATTDRSRMATSSP